MAKLPAARVMNPDEMPTADLVRRISDGAVDAEGIDAERRQECVDYLTQEGYRTCEVAQLLRVAERTVRRDREELRRREAVEPGLGLGDELLGELRQIAGASVQRLRRMSVDSATPAYVKVWAEQAAVRTFQRFVETAYRLSYIEDGVRRLNYLRDTDPGEAERDRKQVECRRGNTRASKAAREASLADRIAAAKERFADADE